MHASSLKSALLGPFAALAVGLALPAEPVIAATAEEIDARVDAALERFREDVAGGGLFLDNAAGVLVFPDVFKAGLGIGGEYGEGALRVGGETVQYYSTASASVGLQFGIQTRAIFLVFMEAEALEKFRKTSGWKVGVDGSVNLIKVGAAGSVDTTNIKDPVVGFVLTNPGLMANLTLEGSKFTKIVRE